MSAKKRRLVSGAVAGMMLSLAIPMASNTGLHAPAAAEAGVGPTFSKPWLAKRKSAFTAIKSYSLPDSLRFRGESETAGRSAEQRAILPPGPTADGDTDSEVLQELNRLYQEDGNASSQRAFGRRSQRGEQENRGLFGRLFDAVTRTEVDSSTPSVTPGQNGADKPDDASLVRKPADNHKAPFFEPIMDEPAPVAVAEQPAPAADIIIPPQPQPHLLPAFDVADSELISPAESALPKNDPFPIPPLPDGFDTGSTTAQLLPGFSLPPLPGEEFLAQSPPEPATAEISQESQTDSAIVNTEPAPAVHPLAEDALLPEPQAPAMAQQTQPAVDPFEQPQPEPAPKTESEMQIADLPEMEERSSDPQAENTQITSAGRPRGEKDTNLPLAPSSRLPVGQWRDADEVVQTQPELTPDQNQAQPAPPAATGWKSRSNNVASQEPNTLNIPEEARPAELPRSRTAQRSEQEEKYLRIAERGERTGFKGFCPVALRDDLELLDASPEFRTEFEGMVYYFSSHECLQVFQADPIRYVPAQGGLDLVKYLQQGTEEPGRLDFAVWYQDRLFLFSSQNTLEQFRDEPGQFVQE